MNNIQVSFVKRDCRVHGTFVPSYWRADRDDGCYYTEMLCETPTEAEFRKSAERHFRKLPITA